MVSTVLVFVTSTVKVTSPPGSVSDVGSAVLMTSMLDSASVILTSADSDTADVRITDAESSIEVIKTADPTSLTEPGGDVTFTVDVTNTSAVDTITLTTIEDDEDNDGVNDVTYNAIDICATTVLAPGESTTCTFTHNVSGSAGDTITDEVTANGTDDEGDPVSDSDTADVRITDAESSIEVIKTADPTSLTEPGGDVTFTVDVTNTSAVDTITLTTIEDDEDNDGVNDVTYNAIDICATTVLAPGESTTCTFTHNVSGSAGDTITDEVTANGTDDEGDPVSDSDTADVRITDAESSIEVIKTADPTSLTEPGGDVTFTVDVTNTSAVDTITLTTIEDDEDNDGVNDVTYNAIDICATTVLAPGESTTCTFIHNVSGSAGDTITDEVTANGTDDEGDPVSDSDDAVVTIIGVNARKTVTDQGGNNLAEAGEVLTYSIEVTNNSTVAVTNVPVVDSIPTNTSYLVGSADATGGIFDDVTNSISWTIASIGVGESETVTFQVTVVDPIPDGVEKIVNLAVVGDPEDPPPDPPDPPTDCVPGDPLCTETPISGSLGDRVWEDSNGDGIQDPTETGINGVTVDLIDASGTVIDSQTTAGDGDYDFTGLAAGDYTVDVTDTTNVLEDYDITTSNDPLPVSLGVGEDYNDADFGYIDPEPVANDDSETTTVDTPVEIDVLDNDDINITPDELASVDLPSPTTSEGGTVSVNDNGTPGDPTDDFIDYTPPPGFIGTDTFEYEICDDDPNPDCDTATVTVTIRDPSEGNIGDRVWEDSNGDGIQDPTETGINGVTVDLIDASGTVIDSQTTAGDGDYDFTGLAAGDYTVDVTDTTNVLEDYDITTSNDPLPVSLGVGEDYNDADFGYIDPEPVANDDSETTTVDTPIEIDVLDNDDINITPDELASVDLPSPTTSEGGTVSVNDNGTPGDPTDDFIDYTPPPGFIGTDTFEYEICDDDPNPDCDTATVTVTIRDPSEGNIGDRVWEDSNGDGIQDPTETGINGVTVDLIDASGTVIDSQTTAGDGDYDFTGLAAGDYTVDVTDTTNVLEDYDITTSNDPLPVSLGVGEDYNDADFGYIDPEPVANDDSETTTVDTPIEIDVLDNDDINITPDELASVDLPSPTTSEGGTVSVNDNGTPGDPTDDFIDYTPPPGFIGTDTFEYEICDDDPNPDCDTATVTVTIRDPSEGNIGDRVWEDSNGDGIQDPTETGINGVTVDLIDASGTVIDSQTTAGDGDYDFTGLAAGDYTVDVTDTTNVLEDYDITTSNDPLPVSLGVGEDYNDADFGYIDPEPVANDDSETTTVDTPIEIDVLDNDDINITPDELASVDLPSPTTSEGGTVSVNDNGTPGDPTDDFIDYTPPPGFIGTDTFEYEICDDDPNPDCDTATVTVTIRDPSEGNIGDRVWEDSNGDGIQDPTETGINGVTVDLIDASGTVIDSQTTAGDGDYDFTGLAAGDYTVDVTDTTNVLEDYDITTSNDPLPVSLGVGEDYNDADFGYIDPEPVANDDSETTTVDTPIEIDVLDNDDINITPDELASVDLPSPTTSEGGTVSVNDNGTPGDPTDDFIDYTPPPGFIGTDTFEYEICDDDPNPDCDTATVTVTIRDPSEGNIGDRVWEDSNGDGIQDPTETGINGVTVDLIDASGTVIDSQTTAGDGDYDFTGLAAGDYTVDVTDTTNVLEDYDITTSNDPLPVSLGVGEDYNDADFGYIDPEPVANDDSETTTVDTPIEIDVLDNDDINITPDELASVDLPSPTTSEGGTVSVNDNGTPGDPTDDFIDYTPPPGFIGTDTFEYEICDDDPNPDCDTATVTVTIRDPSEGNIGDRVWEDSNGDGIQDPTETGINGVTVDLIDASGTVIDSQTTAGDGDYDFTGLAAGDYTVDVTDTTNVLEDYDITTSNDPLPVSLGVGEDYNDADFGYIDPEPVANDDSETTTVDTQVEIDVLDNDDIDITPDELDSVDLLSPTTSEGGTVSVNDNGTPDDPTDDTIDYTPPPGFTGTDTFEYEICDDDPNPDCDTATVTVTIRDPSEGNIGDRVWEDSNGDGIQDPTETGINGVTVDLIDASGTVIDSQTTAGDGDYDFTGLAAGDYTVDVTDTTNVLEDYDITTSNDPLPVSLGVGEDYNDADFGYIDPEPVANDDSETTTVDTPIEIDVLDNDDINITPDELASVDLPSPTTSEGGTVSVNDNGTPGDPTDDFIDYTPPPGFIGTDTFEYEICDDDPNPDCDTATVTVSVVDPNDASIGDFVWEDINGNGIQDTGELGVPGVMVTLIDSNGIVVGTTNTNGNGGYSFNNLGSGDYTVGVILPDGYILSPANQGGNDSLDSDVNVLGQAAVTLASGENNDTIDAGLIPQVSRLVADKVDNLQVDVNGDGIVNPSDTIRYTVTIRNIGDLAVTGVNFSDTPDPNTTLVVGSVTTSQGTVTLGNNVNETSVGVDVGIVGVGSSVTIEFDVTVNNPLAAGVTKVSNQGIVSDNDPDTPDEPTDDPDDPTCNPESDPECTPDPTDTPIETPIERSPDLRATKVDSLQVDVNGDGVVNPGDTIRYTVTISNVGDGVATGVNFSDTPDVNTILVVGSVTTSQGTVTLGNSADETSVDVDVGTVGVGSSVTIEFNITVNSPLPEGVTEVSNQGIVNDDDPETPETPTDDPDDPTCDPNVDQDCSPDPTDTPVESAPELRATKVDSLQIDVNNNGLVNPGDTIRYTVTISNVGDRAATGVDFSDTPDVNTALVVGSVTISQGNVTLGNNVNETSVGVDVGTVGVGSSVTIEFDITVNDPLPEGVTEVSNQGVVSDDDPDTPDEPTDDPDDPTCDPNVDPECPPDPTSTPVERTPELRALKVDSLQVDVNSDGDVNPGDTIRYTITINNVGDEVATGVSFSDTPDANTSLVVGSVVSTKGSVVNGNSQGDTSIVIDIGTVSPDELLTIIFDVVVNSPLSQDITEVVNQGVISDDDPGTPDVLTDDPDDPSCNIDISGADISQVGDFSISATCPPDPTVTPIIHQVDIENPLIGIAKAASPAANCDILEHVVTYVLNVQNYGDVALSNLQVVDGLASIFGAGNYDVAVSSEDFTVNLSYNGNTNQNLLTGADTLAVNGSGIITVSVSTDLDFVAAPTTLDNTATARATSPTNVVVSDQSTNGSNPDPDNNNDPTDNTSATPVTLQPLLNPDPNTVIVTATSTFPDRNYGIGDEVPITVTVSQNTGFNELLAIVRDNPPEGLVYIENSAVVTFPDSSTQELEPTEELDDEGNVVWPLVWSNLPLGSGEELVINFSLRVQTGAAGTITNTVQAQGVVGCSEGPTVNVAADIQVDDEIFSNLCMLIGRVYIDANESGEYDRDLDTPLPGARVVLGNGWQTTTDVEGNYAFRDAACGMGSVQLDKRTAPFTPCPHSEAIGEGYLHQTRLFGLTVSDFPLCPLDGYTGAVRETTVILGPITLKKKHITLPEGIRVVLEIDSTEPFMFPVVLTDPVPNDEPRVFDFSSIEEPWSTTYDLPAGTPMTDPVFEWGEQ